MDKNQNLIMFSQIAVMCLVESRGYELYERESESVDVSLNAGKS